MEGLSVESVSQDWETLDTEYLKLEETHKTYQTAVTEFTKLQSLCFKQIGHQKYRMKQIKQTLERLSPEGEEQELRERITSQMITRKAQISEIEETLPRKSDIYLRIILDGINVTFMDQEQRYRFKEAYEKFKLFVSGLILVVALMDLMFKYRAIDALLHFLLVWYHCTLTIRESILIVNGSRIKGWWRTLQFITTIKAGIIIVWPDGLMYDLFRTQFLWYNCYTTILQFLQFYYQQGCLYRLRALGERYEMDITIQGFHSWMWRGLSFLLPFLYLGYMFQFYNALTLYQLSRHPECSEWQVLVSGVIFFIIFAGNTLTTSLVIYQKLMETPEKVPEKKE